MARQSCQTNQFPLIAYHYTEHGMGSVDTFNQNLKNTTPPRRNFSWKRTAFVSLLSFTLVNLWVVHKQRHEEPIPLGKFLDLMKYDFTSDHTTQLQQRKILKRAERNNRYYQQHKIIANVEHKRKHVEAVKKYKEKRKATLVHTVDEKIIMKKRKKAERNKRYRLKRIATSVVCNGSIFVGDSVGVVDDSIGVVDGGSVGVVDDNIGVVDGVVTQWVNATPEIMRLMVQFQ